MQDNASSLLNKAQLIKLRLKAMRAGVWFKTLHRIDRVLIYLTIRVANRVRSASLANCILSVTRKLEGLLERNLVRAIKEIGFPLACRLSLFAQKWGNNSAQEWMKDMVFVRYLAVMKFNSHTSGIG